MMAESEDLKGTDKALKGRYIYNLDKITCKEMSISISVYHVNVSKSLGFRDNVEARMRTVTIKAAKTVFEATWFSCGWISWFFA